MLRRTSSPALALALFTVLSACSEDKVSPPADPDPPVPGDMTGPEPAAANPFEVGFAVNHDGTQQVLRGWPLVVRISATLASETEETYTLDDDTLSIRVATEDGKVEEWALTAPPETETERALDATVPTLEVVRVLDAEATAALAKGARTVRVTWGNATERFAITVTDPPEDETARALLQADYELLQQDVDAALDALDRQLSATPSSVALLNQRALVHERAGDPVSAFVDAQAALSAFVEEFPDAPEPPVTILQVTNRLLPIVLGEMGTP